MNAQTKPTPGPWQVNRNDLLQICDSDGEVRGCAPIAVVIQTGRPKPRAVDLANARLIAAAPELLAALERLQRNFNLLLVGKPVRDVAETDAEVKAALAKAGAA